METLENSMLFLLLVSFARPAFTQELTQDMSGKMFTFPKTSDTDYVTLVPDQTKPMTAVTVCLRSFSDLTRAQSPFSYATRIDPNTFVIFKSVVGSYDIVQYDSKATFKGLEDKLNEWISLCATWDSTTGLTQLWVNGKPSTRKMLRQGSEISGEPIILLGQDQDSYGGKFDSAQSFVGMMTDVNMWDSVLPHCEIALYMKRIPTNKEANVINWRALKFSLKGYVLVENEN